FIWKPNLDMHQLVAASLNSLVPPKGGYLLLAGLSSALCMESRICFGVGWSGSPIPWLMMSTPRAAAAAAFLPISAKTEGALDLSLCAISMYLSLPTGRGMAVLIVTFRS